MANINVGRKSGFIRRSSGMRRETQWSSDSDFSQTTLASSAAAAIVSQFTVAFLLDNLLFTVIRHQSSPQS